MAGQVRAAAAQLAAAKAAQINAKLMAKGVPLKQEVLLPKQPQVSRTSTGPLSDSLDKSISLPRVSLILNAGAASPTFRAFKGSARRFQVAERIRVNVVRMVFIMANTFNRTNSTVVDGYGQSLFNVSFPSCRL